MCDRRVNQLKGQSLAAINHAAGVNVNLDQTHKFSGYSIANIYGPEELQQWERQQHAVLGVFCR